MEQPAAGTWGDELSYRWVEHTAELELEIDAPDEAMVFADAARALAELLGEERRGEPARREIAVEESERAVLLVRWLDELVFLAETEKLVPDEVERIALSDTGLDAEVRCHRGEPRHLVKGTTYHRLAFGPSAEGFHARVVLDV